MRATQGPAYPVFKLQQGVTARRRLKRGSSSAARTFPDGNADRLFVFHRDVDKARQRLAKGDAAASP